MLLEHDAERTLLQQMFAETASLRQASESARANYRQRGTEYLAIRSEHIWKENDVLYAMGRKVLNEADNTSLLERFERLNSLAYGDKAAENFAQMVQEIEEGAAGIKRPIHNLSHEQLDAIFEAMPFEVTFVDANDQLAYFNRLDRTKIFPRTRSVLGRKVAGRFNVAFDDVHAVAPAALRHRLLLNFEGLAENVPADEIISELLEKTPS